MLENQLELEKMRTEAEKKKVVMVHDQLRDKELQLQLSQTSHRSTPSPSIPLSRDISMDHSMTDSTISQV